MTLSLPTAPNGYQYEDLVAASLRSLGYFTETNMVLREAGSEVFELDVVATPAGPEYANRQLFEAKKRPSFSDMFKVFGQRIYLGIDQACLATLEAGDLKAHPVFEAKGKELSVKLCHHGISDPPTHLASAHNVLPEDERRRIAFIAWYGQIARRAAYEAFVHSCKTHSSSTAYEAARRYDHAVKDSFFTREPLGRASALYNAYLSSPKLTGSIVAEMGGGKDLWQALWSSSSHPGIQYLMLLEATGRIGIVKNALDDLLARGGGPLPKGTLSFGNIEIDYNLYQLPAKYAHRAEWIQSHKHGLRIPYLLQVFVELFGGFLVLDDPSELSLIERVTGVPAGEVRTTLEVIDDLFSESQSSMFTTVGGRLWIMKMIPAFVRGIGAFLRHELLEAKDYDSRYGASAAFHLTRWHLAAYEILKPALSTKVGKTA